jgi:hypothetical protein
MGWIAGFNLNGFHSNEAIAETPELPGTENLPLATGKQDSRSVELQLRLAFIFSGKVERLASVGFDSLPRFIVPMPKLASRC